jgi:hypothetical protein
MKLPKNVANSIKNAIPYSIAEDCEILKIIMIDTVTSGDIMIYTKKEAYFDCDVYANQGGSPVKYEHDKIKTIFNWEEIEYLIQMREDSGWTITAVINKDNGWEFKETVQYYDDM